MTAVAVTAVAIAALAWAIYAYDHHQSVRKDRDWLELWRQYRDCQDRLAELEQLQHERSCPVVLHAIGRTHIVDSQGQAALLRKSSTPACIANRGRDGAVLRVVDDRRGDLRRAVGQDKPIEPAR